MVAGDPYQGGASWAVLQYVLGLARLGHEVTLLEPVADLRPDRVDYFRQLTRSFRLAGRAALVAGSETCGLDRQEVRERVKHADVLLNVSGMFRWDSLETHVPIRVYLDLDPAFNQLWHAAGVDAGLPGHTHYVTIGRRIGAPDCVVPTCGVDWIGTFPPVVLDLWPPGTRIALDAYTTVGNWRSYGPIVHEGVRYGLRAHSLRGLVELPARTSERLVLALAIDPGDDADRRTLVESGFELVDPSRVASSPAAYRRFVRGSKGELGVAKEGYVVSRSGWFSDRSACYLAAGRPVVAQDTGFGEFLPTGAGLFAFADVDGAAAALTEIARDYGRHARAARAIAEEHLDARRVLTRLLEAVGAVPARGHRRMSEVHARELVETLAPLEVAAVRSRPFVYRSSVPISELDVTLADDTRLDLLVKELGRDAWIGRAAEAKPAFLDDPLREIETYRRSLAGAGLGTPVYYGAKVDETAGRYWLALERVVGTELYQVGELELWQLAVRWLARFHQAELPRHEHLLVYARDYYDGWFERARAAGHDLPTGWAGATDVLLRSPVTLIHGELYASNVLVAGDRVAAVDWELAALGPGTVDLAALVTGWEGSDREALVGAYEAERAEPSQGPELRESLAAARLHLAVRWLGWSPRWTAPPEHARDWLAEARAAADELGL